MQAALDTSAAQQRQAKEAADRNSAQAARERDYKVENDFFLQFGTSDR